MVEITKQRKCNAHVRLPREACDEHVYAAKKCQLLRTKSRKIDKYY